MQNTYQFWRNENYSTTLHYRSYEQNEMNGMKNVMKKRIQKHENVEVSHTQRMYVRRQ